jgi:hypothetical protein
VHESLKSTLDAVCLAKLQVSLELTKSSLTFAKVSATFKSADPINVADFVLTPDMELSWMMLPNGATKEVQHKFLAIATCTVEGVVKNSDDPVNAWTPSVVVDLGACAIVADIYALCLAKHCPQSLAQCHEHLVSRDDVPSARQRTLLIACM